MSTPLLTTKLYIPSPRSDRVPRPRLIERLNQGLRQKLTLISAPAGFGKTTLVSEWLTSKKDEGGRRKAEKEKFHPSSLIPHPFQAAWLSLDEADNDPPRFLTYLIAVLQQINPEMGQTAQSMLQASQLPRTETLLTTLINEIATFPGEFALVLDDYHVIDDQAIHQAMDFLIAHLPSHVHLIITSRSQPPLNLSRLRGQGQLLELNSADLRFTAIEVE